MVFHLKALILPKLFETTAKLAQALSKLPKLFREPLESPLSYLRHAKRMVQFFAVQFVDSRVNFQIVNGLETVTLLAPKT